MNHYIDIATHYRQYKKVPQNRCTDVEVCKLSQRAENIRSVAAFFCLKCLIGYTRYGRSGRAAFGWPCLVGRYSHPCSVYHHSVRRMAVGLQKTYLRVIVMKKSIHVLEHTPIYDLDAYNQRQRRQKIKNAFKNTAYGIFYLSVMLFSMSFLFVGE